MAKLELERRGEPEWRGRTWPRPGPPGPTLTLTCSNRNNGALLLTLGQEVLFCPGRGRQEWLARERAGQGVPAPPPLPPAAAPRFRPRFWTRSSAPTSRGAAMGQAPRLPGLARRRQARSPPRPPLGGLLQAATGQEDPGPGRRRPGGCPARPGLRDRPALRRLGESRSATQIVKTGREGVGSFPSLIIDPPLACSLLLSHPIPAAGQPRTRFQVRFWFTLSQWLHFMGKIYMPITHPSTYSAGAGPRVGNTHGQLNTPTDGFRITQLLSQIDITLILTQNFTSAPCQRRMIPEKVCYPRLI